MQMDKISPERRSSNMRKIGSKGMAPEVIVRKTVYALGYRYRLHKSDLPGKPDLAFSKMKKAIFVHGCFWHQHPEKSCLDSRIPKSNTGYWLPKLEGNVERDERNIKLLKNEGWSVLVIWECETKDGAKLTARLCKFLET